MKSLLIAILVIVPLYAFSQDASMPSEAKKVIDKYDASVEVARKAFDAAVAKAREQALKDLKPIQASETKKGNLDGALLVKSKIDELVASGPGETLVAVKDPRITKENRDFFATLVGSWVGDGVGGPWTFSMSGDELILTETEGGRRSTKVTFTKEGSILFDWAGTPAVMEVTRLGSKKLKLACHTSAEMTKSYWTQNLSKK